MMANLAVPHSGRLPGSSYHRSGIRAERVLESRTALEVRRRAVLEGCKWDPQVGDVATLAPFPVMMRRTVWEQLAVWAEKLAAEAGAAEREIADRPDLIRRLGLPRKLQGVLAEETEPTPPAGRVIRFDFHFTTEGWRISEANSDVPGGFSEASQFTGLMAGHFPDLQTAGDPGKAWCDALSDTVGQAGAVGLLSAPGYMEDYQVICFLAMELRRRGCKAFPARPEQIQWRDGHAQFNTAYHHGPVGAVVRFYQAEWLARLPGYIGWKQLFRGGKTPVTNPAFAVISESKRFPLVWDDLSADLSTWRRLLPATRDPREVSWSKDDCWLVKTAMSNNGDTVSIRELMESRQWLQTRWSVLLRPQQWIAQRRFESVPIPTPHGPRHMCVGVYTVNGRAAGAYTRMSDKPLIDFAAVDVALLIEDD